MAARAFASLIRRSRSLWAAWAAAKSGSTSDRRPGVGQAHAQDRHAQAERSADRARSSLDLAGDLGPARAERGVDPSSRPAPAPGSPRSAAGQELVSIAPSRSTNATGSATRYWTTPRALHDVQVARSGTPPRPARRSGPGVSTSPTSRRRTSSSRSRVVRSSPSGQPSASPGPQGSGKTRPRRRTTTTSPGATVVQPARRQEARHERSRPEPISPVASWLGPRRARRPSRRRGRRLLAEQVVGRPLGEQAEQGGGRGEDEGRPVVEDRAIGLERPDELVELRVAGVGLVEEPGRLGVPLAADPLGLGVGLGQDRVALALGLAGEVWYCASPSARSRSATCFRSLRIRSKTAGRTSTGWLNRRSRTSSTSTPSSPFACGATAARTSPVRASSCQTFGSVEARLARSRRPIASLRAAETRSLSRASAASSVPADATNRRGRPPARRRSWPPPGSACPP